LVPDEVLDLSDIDGVDTTTGATHAPCRGDECRDRSPRIVVQNSALVISPSTGPHPLSFWRGCGPWLLVPQTTSSSWVAARDLAPMTRRDSAGDVFRGVASLRKRNEVNGLRAPLEQGSNL
jgi:hypothetical protein